MKSFVALTVLLRLALAAPVDSADNAAMEKRQFFDSTDFDDFLSSLSSLLGQLPTETESETISATVSGTPTGIYTVATTATSAEFEDFPGPSFERRQAPSNEQLAAIISSLESLIAPATTTAEALGCPTDVVSISATVSGTPTQILGVTGTPAVPAVPVAPTVPAAAPFDF